MAAIFENQMKTPQKETICSRGLVKDDILPFFVTLRWLRRLVVQVRLAAPPQLLLPRCPSRSC
jgi:hypothetical protein